VDTIKEHDFLFILVGWVLASALVVLRMWVFARRRRRP